MVHSCSGLFFAISSIAMCLFLPNVAASAASGELCLLQSSKKTELHDPAKRSVAHHHAHAHAPTPPHAHAHAHDAHRPKEPEDSAQQSVTALEQAQNDKQGKMHGEGRMANQDKDSVEESTFAQRLIQDGSSILSIIHPLMTLILLGLVLRREFKGKAVQKFGEGNERFSPAAGLDNVVWVSGKVGDTDFDSIEKQAETALANVDSVLETSGTSKEKLLYAQIYLRSARDADAFNKVWATWLSGNKPPARVCFEAQLLRPTALLEISVVAAR